MVFPCLWPCLKLQTLLIVDSGLIVLVTTAQSGHGPFCSLAVFLSFVFTYSGGIACTGTDNDNQTTYDSHLKNRRHCITVRCQVILIWLLIVSTINSSCDPLASGHIVDLSKLFIIRVISSLSGVDVSLPLQSMR